MTFKHFIKKFKKNFSFRKKVLLFGGLSIIIIFGAIIVTTSDSMFSSVLNLSQIAQQRKINFSQKQIKTQDTCVDTDWWKNYYEKGTITVVINWNQRVEQDSCNTNGTLRERFCGQPGDAAGLLRSENYVDCEYGCYDGTCITTWTIKDVAIEWGTFVASDNQHASIEINLRNVWTTSIHTDGIWHGLSLDGNTYVDYWVAYDFWLLNNSNTILQPNETYTIFANVTLMGNNYFSNNSYINIGISTYPDTDDIPSNNSYNLYLTGNFSSSTGQIVDCTTPENILACNLWLSSCPPECTGQIFTGWIGDIIIEDMFISPNPVATLELTNVINKVNLKVKNIGSGNIIIPYANSEQRLSLWCYEAGRWGWTLTIPIWQTILAPNETITTQLYNTSDHRFSSIWQKSLTCTIDSQQQWSRSSPDPNNTWTIYESNWQNNSFTLNYMVSGTLQLPQGDLIIEDMYMTPDNTPTIWTDALTNIFNLVIKNIWSWDITIPTNTYTKMWLICYYNVWHGWFHTLSLNINTIAPNQSITTQIEILNPAVDPGWFDTLWPKYMQCIITSQQQQLWASPDPNNQFMIYETDGTNNSFTLDYEVVSSKSAKTLQDKIKK